jgi:hypothetical protein
LGLDLATGSAPMSRKACVGAEGGADADGTPKLG